jgi:excisionase family DNA binding protein
MLPPQMVYKLVETGRLSGYRVGKSIRIDPESVAAYRQENRFEKKSGCAVYSRHSKPRLKKPAPVKIKPMAFPRHLR